MKLERIGVGADAVLERVGNTNNTADDFINAPSRVICKS